MSTTRTRLSRAAAGIATCALVSTLCTPPAAARTYEVYYLGGQSNMDGYGYVKELPAELNGPVAGVYIFQAPHVADGTPPTGAGRWATLQPGHGVGFGFADGKNQYSERFGLELTFGRRVHELRPAANIALLKFSRGGTAIDCSIPSGGCWDPDFGGADGHNQYDGFLAAVREAFKARDIDGDGEEDTLVPAGIIWMQGESDACRKDVAERYGANLKRLMDLMRAAFRQDDLPVVIVRISDSGQDKSDGRVWDFGDIVRAQEADFVQHDACATLVTTTDGYGYSDAAHYNSAGYLDLGRECAEHVVKLQKKEP